MLGRGALPGNLCRHLPLLPRPGTPSAPNLPGSPLIVGETERYEWHPRFDSGRGTRRIRKGGPGNASTNWSRHAAGLSKDSARPRYAFRRGLGSPFRAPLCIRQRGTTYLKAAKDIKGRWLGLPSRFDANSFTVDTGDVLKINSTTNRYVPDKQNPIRCAACGRLMAWDFTVEGACPTCRWDWENKRAEEMVLEAMQIEAVFGGWSRGVLERLNDGLPEYESGVCQPDGFDEDDNPIPGDVKSFQGPGQEGEVARELAKYCVTKKREVVDRKKAIKGSTSMSELNRILGENPARDLGV